MLALIVSLASLGLVSLILPDSILEWITEKAGDLILLIAEPAIQIFTMFFDGLKSIVEKLFMS